MTYVVRLSGTVSTKSSRTRRRFVHRLEQNIRDALDRSGVDYEFESDWSRLFVHSSDERVGEILATVAGVQSVRPSHRSEWTTIDDIVERGAELFAEKVADKTFAVRARRVGPRDQFDFDSMAIQRRLGAVLDERAASVDLDDPEVEASLEIHRDCVYFYDHDIPGPGGLPVGVEGRTLALVSGGFDSAVAAWSMLKRGVALDFLFFNLGGPPHERGVRQVIGDLAERWAHGYEPKLHVVDFRPILADLKVNVPGKYWQVLLKRLMMRAADLVVEDLGCPAMITGEAMGQVSSQTLANLAAIEAPIAAPILRPLVGYNKEEIIAIARRVGVHDVAEKVPEFCALQGGPPVTSTTEGRLDEQEANIDFGLLERMTDERRIEDLRELVDSDDEALDVRIGEVPENAAVLDLRSESKFESWHFPDAMHVPFETALEQHAMLPQEPTWVLYCEVGLKSALVAEKMRQAGFDAFSFRGGVPKLRKACKQPG